MPTTSSHGTAASIAQVDFGRLDAEFDQNLEGYFVDTGVLAKLKSGTKSLILGRKGSGKTALFRLATVNNLGHPVLAVELSAYPWELHKRVREAGMIPESAYVVSWKFMFLVAACRHVAETIGGGTEADRAKKILRDIYGDESPSFADSLFDRLKRLRKLDLPKVTGLGSLGGFELEHEEGPILARAISQWVRILEDFVTDAYQRQAFTIAIDRLDDGWDASDDSKAMLVGVLKAARELNLKLGRRGTTAPTLVFLRSDIFNELQFNDKNKMSADTEYLDWSGERLIDVPEARIARSLGIARKGAFDRVFSDREMRQRASIRSYILKRAMGRPRDLIAFCSFCQEVATGAHHDRVETEDVYAAEAHYSRHIYSELRDEMHKQIPDTDRLFNHVAEIGKTRFALADWYRVLSRENISTDSALTKLKVLYEYSVVGLPKRGGAGGGTSYQYAYDDRFLQPVFVDEVIVHPSLKKQLQLVEKREGSDSDT